jgi:hypothetical protein
MRLSCRRGLKDYIGRKKKVQGGTGGKKKKHEGHIEGKERERNQRRKHDGRRVENIVGGPKGK